MTFLNHIQSFWLLLRVKAVQMLANLQKLVARGCWSQAFVSAGEHVGACPHRSCKLWSSPRKSSLPRVRITCQNPSSNLSEDTIQKMRNCCLFFRVRQTDWKLAYKHQTTKLDTVRLWSMASNNHRLAGELIVHRDQRMMGPRWQWKMVGTSAIHLDKCLDGFIYHWHFWMVYLFTMKWYEWYVWFIMVGCVVTLLGHETLRFPLMHNIEGL